MKILRKIGWIVLINIFLVILAGSVVRMTGSGMGCPDWPKCFGYLIPPTEKSQLLWEEGREFEKGQLIIREESLWKANSDFVAGDSYNQDNWEKYTKHDYAKFNVFHTWTEYINRLFGALLGFFALIVIVLAARKWKVNKWLFALAFFQLILILFEAWLGKLTVDTNLNPYMITYHMIGVTVMVVVQLVFLKLVNREIKPVSTSSINGLVRFLGILGIILMFFQIILGTQVRQQTDEMVKGEIPRELIANGFDWVFFVHRSFSFLILFAVIFLVLRLRNIHRFIKPLMYLVLFTILEVLAGIILYYAGMPAFAQPLHLLFSILIFGFFVEVYLRMFSRLSSK